MAPLLQALPPLSTANGNRGRRRRRTARNRGRPAAGLNLSAATTTVRGKEFLGAPTATLQTLAFTGAFSGSTRLLATAKTFSRYRIKNLKIWFESGVGMATTGNVSFGISPGTLNANVKDADTILKLNPSTFTPGWKSAGFIVGQEIDMQKWYITNSTDADGTAFCLYIIASAEKLGQISVTYDIEYSMPNPFV